MIPGGNGNSNAATTNLFATNAVVLLAAGSTLDFSGQSQTLAGLYGSGLVTNGTLTVSDTIAPGGTNHIGTLTIAQTTLSGTLLVDVDAQTNDCLQVVGDLNLSGMRLQIANPASLKSNTQYAVATYTGTLTGTLTASDLPTGWHLLYNRPNQVILVCRSGIAILVY